MQKMIRTMGVGSHSTAYLDKSLSEGCGGGTCVRHGQATSSGTFSGRLDFDSSAGDGLGNGLGIRVCADLGNG